MPSKVRKVIETLFRVYDKNGELVDFKFNEIQIRIDDEIIHPIEQFRELYGQNLPIPEYLQNRLRNSILKYRQGGVTTLVMAWYLVECMTRYACTVMLTHDKEHSERLLQRARTMLKHLKGAQPATSKINENEIGFSKTDSLFYIGTAGSKEFGRSATITHLHASEIAFWKDPASLMKSLFQAIPKHTGVITQETTANGWGNWFQKSFYSYLVGRGGFNAKFYPWYIHNEYFSDGVFIWDLVSIDERKVEKQIYRRVRKEFPSMPKSEILRKLQWRREKIDENQGDKDRDSAIRDFNQEYPSTIEEAFITSGGSLFGNVRRVVTKYWNQIVNYTFGLSTHPRKDFTYILGADYSGGTGNDYSAINILCLETREQVLVFRDNRHDPLRFSEKIIELGTKYNFALVVAEVNSHGLAGLAILKRSYPLDKIYKRIIPKGESNAQRTVASYGYGWQTTQTSKAYMVGITQQLLAFGIKIYDLITEDELRSFIEDPETGKIDGSGAHDDTAIAFMLACIGVLKLIRVNCIDMNEPLLLDENDLPQVVDTFSSERSKILPTWRDDQGCYQVPFKDMFDKRRPRYA